MGKRSTTIYIEDELVAIAKKEGINISQFVEQQLKNRVELLPKGIDFNKKKEDIRNKQRLLEIELEELIKAEKEFKHKEPLRKQELSDKLKKEVG